MDGVLHTSPYHWFGGFYQDFQNPFAQFGIDPQTIFDICPACRTPSARPRCAGFIDPVFSTGLQITFNSAYRLAEALSSFLDDPSRRSAALKEYDRKVDRYYHINGTLVPPRYTWM